MIEFPFEGDFVILADDGGWDCLFKVLEYDQNRPHPYKGEMWRAGCNLPLRRRFKASQVLKIFRKEDYGGEQLFKKMWEEQARWLQQRNATQQRRGNNGEDQY